MFSFACRRWQQWSSAYTTSTRLALQLTSASDSASQPLSERWAHICPSITRTVMKHRDALVFASSAISETRHTQGLNVRLTLTSTDRSRRSSASPNPLGLQLATLRADTVIGGNNLVCLVGRLLSRVSGNMADRTAVSAVLAQLLPPLVRCVSVAVQKLRV